jgi:hypothetical protein
MSSRAFPTRPKIAISKAQSISQLEYETNVVCDFVVNYLELTGYGKLELGRAHTRGQVWTTETGRRPGNRT